MIDFLQNRKLVNNLELESSFIDNSKMYDSHAIQYLKEIPPKFIQLQFKRNKKELITNHLKTLYPNVTNDKVENVLNRVKNLIIYVTSNDRKDYENFTQHHNFKVKNWKKIERCQICGFKFRKINDTSLEHVLPLSLGGADNDTNWQLLCKECNGQKSNFWGLSDLKLVDHLICKNILKAISIEEIKDNLPKSIKYFILENNKRKCFTCDKTSSNSKLEVKIDFSTMINIDSFSAICENCIKSQKINKKFLL